MLLANKYSSCNLHLINVQSQFGILWAGLNGLLAFTMYIREAEVLSLNKYIHQIYMRFRP